MTTAPAAPAMCPGNLALRFVVDPSRSGDVPVPVPGVLRLLVEAVVIGGGSVGWATGGLPVLSGALVTLTIVHHGVARRRLTWLGAVR